MLNLKPKFVAGLCATLGVACFVGCKAGSLESTPYLPEQPRAALSPPADGGTGAPGPTSTAPQLATELTGVNIAQTSYLYSIANPKAPAEKCWYLADKWGQSFTGGTSPEMLAKLQPLTTRSLTQAAMKTALAEQATKEKSWQDFSRFVLAGCAVALPFAKTPPGAIAVAVCGASGTFSEKNQGDKVTSTAKAAEVTAGNATIGVADKKIIEVIEAALKGKVGDGSLNCAQALATVRKNLAKKP
jgi:hypothetical protein